MFNRLIAHSLFWGFRFLFMHMIHVYFLCLTQTQRKLISAHLHLYRVTHRCNLLQSDFRSRRQPHIQKMMPQGTFSTDRRDIRALPRL